MKHNWEMKNPSTWLRARLGEICIVERGSSPRPIEKYLTGNAYKTITIIGEKVNLANRICNIAEKNMILISEYTYKFVKDKFKFIKFLLPKNTDDYIKGKSIKDIKRHKINLYKIKL